MSTTKRVERFTTTELLGLQCDLQQMELDALQAADLLSAFLNGRGYGVHPERLQDLLARLESTGGDTTSMQTELEHVALVM
jgi:hypothetical protein